MMKVKIKYFLLLCLIALSCSSAGSGGEDKFIEINFDPSSLESPNFHYVNPAKHFSFTVTPGGGESDSSENCTAVTWEGRLGQNDFYGFAVEKDDFHLILYFPKQGSGFNKEGIPFTLEPPSRQGVAPASGQYIAVMRNGNTVYKNPQDQVSLSIQHSTPDSNLTTINMTTPIVFDTPTTTVVTQSGLMTLRAY
ncbi:MAG: hypothetical protein FWG92_00595 [Leptospirales bacterium]|nr:hypothetical protein [Leptospirales bacterium]